MSALTGVTLCSGGGGSALGLRAAGVQPVGAVEYGAAIAAQYAANLGDHVLVARLQDVDFRQFIGVDMIQDSNPCPNFSNAKPGGEETPNDLAIADATCRAIRTIRPRYFWLENVEGYAKSESYRRIRAALDDLDYWSHATVVNAADYGVPQTRRRLILRAVAGGWMQPFRPLPAPVPWVGWYAAIADLLDTLPETQPAPWQLKYLPLRAASFMPSSVTADGTTPPRLAMEPALTVQGTADKQMPRAFLLDGMNARTEIKGGLNVLAAWEPMLSIPASGKGTYRAWLECGRWVKMTPRALARFQAFPDSYALPEQNALACRIVGNAVPVLLAQRITESLLDGQAGRRAA